MELTFQGVNGNTPKIILATMELLLPDSGNLKDSIGQFLTLYFGNLYHYNNTKF
jgi:hypothetical protein